MILTHVQSFFNAQIIILETKPSQFTTETKNYELTRENFELEAILLQQRDIRAE